MIKKKTLNKKVNSLLSSMIIEDNNTLTQNLAPTFKSTLNNVLDLFSMGGSLRMRSEQEIISMFSKAFAEDKLLTLKCIFNIRNCRGGVGERRTFRYIIKYLGEYHSSIVKKNIDNIVYFGRYDDLLALFGTKSEKLVLNYIKTQLEKDIENCGLLVNKSISLLAKWLPSENTSSANTVSLAKKIRSFLNWTPKQYRKTLSLLRKQIDVVERKMSAKEWHQINYSSVPSKANLNYRKAFSRHDFERYSEFIENVKVGKVKINASTLYPYDIVRKILDRKTEDTLNILWNALPNYMEDNSRNILAVCDVSGSMQLNNNLPMAISISLGIYTAERNKGSFSGYFITYSNNPVLQKISGSNIVEKVKNLQKTSAYSTDLQKVFSMLLRNAVESSVKQEDMPEQILVITDCEFNDSQNGKTNLETIKDQYKNAGYKMPQLVFWNVNSMQNNVPATANENGVLLVSGASPSVFKTLLYGKQYSPIDQMLETLNSSLYDRVTV